jgi:hypothetical protein
MSHFQAQIHVQNPLQSHLLIIHQDLRLNLTKDQHLLVLDHNLFLGHLPIRGKLVDQ